MPYSYLHYDVFTSEPLLGNQLAVFTDARGMDGGLMQRIARELNFSESTFILPAEQDGADVRMRIFTPASELPMAGHPTIGSAFALANAGVIAPGTSRFVFGLGTGPAPVDLEWADRRLRFAWMSQGRPTFYPPLRERAPAAEAIGLKVEDLSPQLPVQVVSCGLPFLLVPLRDRTAVDRAAADAAGFRRLHPLLHGSHAVFLFAASPSGARETVYSRMFAPAIGIIEDPATGSASGALGCYLVRHGVVGGDAAQRMVSLQGVAMGRASHVHIAVSGTGEVITGVKVGGQAVQVGRGQLDL